MNGPPKPLAPRAEKVKHRLTDQERADAIALKEKKEKKKEDDKEKELRLKWAKRCLWVAGFLFLVFVLNWYTIGYLLGWHVGLLLGLLLISLILPIV